VENRTDTNSAFIVENRTDTQFRIDTNSAFPPKLSPSNTPRSLRIKFEEVIDHATARHNARRKIVREDSDGWRLINELEQIVVHACWELLSCLAS
jgi:hypothetical protein